MEREIDLATADRDVLIGIIVRQQASIEGLEKRIAQLEGLAKPGGSRGMPGLKPKADRKPAPPQQPRQPRPHGFARVRMTPTQRVEHALENCPGCGTQLSGGWTHRTREVMTCLRYRQKLPSTSISRAPAPGAGVAAYLRRNWTGWCWESSVWGSTWSA